MANPTQNYGWTFPTENQDPWQSAFDTFASAIDTSIRSVENLAPTRVMLCMSIYPTATVAISGATTLPAAWTVFSVAPFGRAVSSFSLVGSGCQLAAELRGTYYLESAVASFSQSAATYFRLVVNPGSISFTTDSGWKNFSNLSLTHLPINFHHVGSLAAGNYSVELQVRMLSFANTGSRFTMDSNDWLSLRLINGAVMG